MPNFKNPLLGNKNFAKNTLINVIVVLSISFFITHRIPLPTITTSVAKKKTLKLFCN